MWPRFEGDPIDKVLLAVDSTGRQTLQYGTTTGAVLSREAAMQLAFLTKHGS